MSNNKKPSGQTEDDTRIRLCAVTTVPLTMTTFLVNQLDYLSRFGFDITVVCDEGLEHPFVGRSLRYVPVAMKRDFNFLAAGRALLSLYRLFKNERFDIIQYATPKAALFSSVAGFLAGIPVRLYCQWGIVYTGSSGVKRTVLKILEKLSCRLSTHVAPDSFGNLEFAVTEGLYPRSKGSVVHYGSANGVDLQRFDLEQKENWRQKVRREWNISEESPVFGFIGRITRDKGVNELMKAFESLSAAYPQAVLLVAGGWDDSQGLEEGVKDCLLKHPRVRYVGRQEQPEQYIAAMDIMVLPSYREGFGVVAIESQAMGVPVITTDIPGPREAVIDGVTGLLVPPKDIPALEKAMEQMLTIVDVKEMGRSGTASVREKYEQKAFWQAVLEHRKGMLGERLL